MRRQRPTGRPFWIASDPVVEYFTLSLSDSPEQEYFMSHFSLYALLTLALVGVASAQDASVQPQPAEAAQPVAQTRVSLTVTPSMAPVTQAISASGMSDAKAVLVLDYDADGVPVNLALDPASGNEELDRAILAWGREARVTPGKGGTGRLPFNLMVDQENDSSKQQKEIEASKRNTRNER